MARVYSRSRAEQELVHALTRQVGYTSGAYSIRRMANLVGYFRQANEFQFELAKRLSDEKLTRTAPEATSAKKKLGEDYATEILNFTSELGLISRIPSASAAKLNKFILSDAGVSIRAARAFAACDEKMAANLETLVLEHLILENDADAYLTLLSLLVESPSLAGEGMAEAFVEEVYRMRNHRWIWMRRAFPSTPVLERLVKSGASQVHWLKKERLKPWEVDHPSKDFGRHHATPRKSWAHELGHLDERGLVTHKATDLLQRARWPGLGGSGWISPPPECLAYLRAQECADLVGASAPTFDLLRLEGKGEPANDEVLDSAANFLKQTFAALRLYHARQAPTAALRYFLVLEERKQKRKLDFDQVLVELAKKFISEISFFSSRMGTFAYYQLRRTNV